ncbi:flavodoxin-dependent (E)-4-hydroxy-3-methylbut-2-enyl-diphosphate synthase [Elusimicrobiota bacterium]
MITRKVSIGNIEVGGGNPVAIQGMLKNPLDNLDELFKEALRMRSAGADIIRCAVPESNCAHDIYKAISSVGVPLVADCHFQTDIVISCIEAGFDKVRVNPGNMGIDGIRKVIECAKKNETAIRFGFNTGSCDAKTGDDLARAALDLDSWVREQGYENYVISMKSSSVLQTVAANRYFSVYSDTPLHIGVTATGIINEGIIKSSIGLGALLLDGIGDTLRVSLTGDSIEEIRIGHLLFDICTEQTNRLQLISCPTCSRKRADVEELTGKFLSSLSEADFRKPVKVAIMGCEVNGPGEARESDIGICATKKGALLIAGGKILKTIKQENILSSLKEYLDKL